MRSRRRTLFISNIAWDFVWQRHQTLASLFAEDDEVVFCEVPGIRRLGWRDTLRVVTRIWLMVSARRAAAAKLAPTNVTFIRPFVLPATNAWFRTANSRILRRLVAHDPRLSGTVDLIVDYSPTGTAVQMLNLVPHRQLIYDCTDNWLAVRGIPATLATDEQAILRRADLTLVPSRRLEELKRPFARRLVRLPHGALVERFEIASKALATGDRLTLLYYGHLHSQHLDVAAVDAIARSRPLWKIVLIGPAKEHFRFPPNVRLLGQVPHDQLRVHLSEADVLILPYVLNEYTRAVMPAKTYECLATGLPIVAAPLPELVADFSTYMDFAPSVADWVVVIEAAVRDDSEAARTKRRALARANSWTARYRRIRELIGEALASPQTT